MPKVDGPKLAARLLAGQPALPIIFMSGHLYGHDVTRGRFLPKPFKAPALIQIVTETIGPAA